MALAKKGRARKPTVVTRYSEGRTHIRNFTFDMVAGYMGDEAAVAVGALYSDPGAEFTDDVLNRVRAQIQKDQARLLACSNSPDSL